MKERRTVLLLFLIMGIVVLAAGAISMGLLYRVAFREEEARLVEAAQSQARLLEAVARFDAVQSADYPGGGREATLSQIRDAHEHYAGFGRTGEFTLAERQGDLMVFLLRHRHSEVDLPRPIPFDSGLAEPMRLSLSGRSGTLVGLDYRGELVLAAYEPVRELGLGIVAKIDMGEIREPFLSAALFSGIGAALLILAGGALFHRVSERSCTYLDSDCEPSHAFSLSRTTRHDEPTLTAPGSLPSPTNRKNVALLIRNISWVSWGVRMSGYLSSAASTSPSSCL